MNPHLLNVGRLPPALEQRLAQAYTLVSLADTISTSSAFAARTGQEIDGNGEMEGDLTSTIGTSSGQLQANRPCAYPFSAVCPSGWLGCFCS